MLRRILKTGAVVLLAVVVGAVLATWWMRPRVSETEVRSTVVSTIQSEAEASFYVTGTLQITATATVSNTKYLLPDLFRFDLGTTRATVRLPGHVTYGFDVRRLRADDIHVTEDGVIEVDLPELSVFTVEPNLDEMEVQTDVGWARRHASSGQRAQVRAMQYAAKVLREQGTEHLKTSTQPRVNTARALETLLTPALKAAGVEKPVFRFKLGPGLVLEPSG